MIQPRRTSAALATAVLLALTLAACTAPPTGPLTASSGPPSSAAPVTHPSAVAVPTIAPPGPSPTVEPVAAADPIAADPTLPLACGEVLSVAEASALLHRTVTITIGRDTLRGDWTVAERQAGLLSCVWGGRARTDNGWDIHIALDVLPNAAAAYRMVSKAGATPYRAGTAAQYSCGAFGSCSVDLLSDGYWAHAVVGFDTEPTPPTKAVAEAQARRLLDVLDSRIASAGAADRSWTAPPGVVTGAFCSNSAVATAKVEGALHGSGLTERRRPTVPGSPSEVAMLRSRSADCSWTDSSGNEVAGVTVVPGGAWAFPSMLRDAPTPSYQLPALKPIDVPGFPTAIGACGGANGCVAYIDAGGSLVSIGGSEKGFPAAVARIAREVVAAG